MALNEPQKKYLRGLGHKLNPVILVGDGGLSESLLAEYERTLNHHELIKVNFRVGERTVRDELIQTLLAGSKAELVQRVGNTALVYRENPEKRKIRLPRA